MTLEIINYTMGVGSLGKWGEIRLTGATSAFVRTTQCEDVELPGAISEQLPHGITILNEMTGRLLLLPFSGELVACYDLVNGNEAAPPVTIPRDVDVGMRIADFRLPQAGGVIYKTEKSLVYYTSDLDQAWRRDEDFAGWAFEGTYGTDIFLVSGDWTGNAQRQVRSLSNGEQTR
jgi:hypothetical protein